VAHDGVSPVAWRLGAYIVAERAGRVLMIESVQSGRWELPGGGVELEEPLPAGAARECFEETGYRVTPAADPLHVSEQLFFWQGDVPHYWHAVAVFFRATIGPDAEPAGPPDHAEVRAVRWVAPADLSRENTQPFQRGALRRAGLL
jgi:8-oxo-dGTP pyrophosphatase MutT (NUDIX family)